MQKIKTFFKNNWILIVILLVATFARFYSLSTLPPGLYPDEAANGQDVIRMIDNHDFRVVYDTNGPREALFIYFQGFFVWIGTFFGIAALNYTALSLRVAPAIIGVVSVWVLYLLAKEMFNKNVGLIAAAAMAASAWHIQFSRNGFRAIMLPLALSLLFYFFIRAYREGKLKDYVLFGTVLALGFYTYLSIRMVPLIFMAFLVWIFFFDKQFLKKNIKNLGWAVGAFFIVMIPMIAHFVNVPADILGRASTSIFNSELNNGSALLTFLGNIKKEILMFNFSGDANFRHNLGGSAMLDLATGIFFWIGAVFSLLKIKKIEHFILWAWFGAMSLPMILTAEGIPHALRLVGAMPVIFIWIALGLNWIAEKIKNQKVRYALVTLVMLAAGFLGLKKYFVDFPSHVEAREAYTEDMVRMARDLNNADPGTVSYMITGDFGLKTVNFLTHAKKPEYMQMETYNIANDFHPTTKKFTIYVTPAWLASAENEFAKLGNIYGFHPTYSEVDGKVLYYVYQN